MLISELLKTRKIFTKSELVVIDYIQKNVNEIYELSLQELAEQTYVSPSTISRLSKKLGFSKYSQFKLSYITELKSILKSGEIPKEHLIKKNQPIFNTIDALSNYQITAIEKTKFSIDTKQIDRVSDEIWKLQNVSFFAFDNNASLAENSISNFLSLGIDCKINITENNQYLNSIILNGDSCAIILSKTGDNRRLIEISKILKAKGVYTVLITSSSNSALSKFANETFFAYSNEKYLDFGYMFFRVGTQFILDTLFAVILSKHKEKANTIDNIYSHIYFDINE